MLRSTRRTASGQLAVSAMLSALALTACGGSKSAAPRVAAQVEASRQSDSLQVDVDLKPDTLFALVVDANEEPVSGVDVVWAVVSGAGSLDSTTTVTNSEGTADAVYTPTKTLGTDRLTATALALTPATFAVSVLPGEPATVSPISGNGLSGSVGTALSEPCVVRVTDAVGNAVPNVVVTWQASGGGMLSPSSSTTNVTGDASATLILGPFAGTDTVTATVAGVAPVTFIETGN